MTYHARARALGALLVAISLVGCAVPAGRPMPPASGASGSAEADPAAIAAGGVAGVVATPVAGTFRPVAGAEVRAGGQRTTTDADGRYTFAGLPPGRHAVAVTAPGFEAAVTHVTVTPVQGVSRANVALAAAGYALTQAGPIQAVISGVVTDPRGAALGGATVHVITSAANMGAGSNALVTADAQGFYTAVVPNVEVSEAAPGIVEVAASALSPGGIRLETSRFLSGRLIGPNLVVSPQLDAFEVPDTPVISGPGYVLPGELAAIHAAKVSSRSDEFYVEVTSGTKVYGVLPLSVAAGTVTFRAPFTLPASTFKARIVPFGQVGGASPTSPAFQAAYTQADLDADLLFQPVPTLVDATLGAVELNGGLLVPGDVAELEVTFRNANPNVSQDLRLEGTIPAGAATILGATANGVPLGASDMVQPDANGRFTVQGFRAAADGTPMRVAVRFALAATLAQGAAFGVTGLAASMPSAGLTATGSPPAPAALSVRSVAPGGFTVAKAVTDDALAGDGRGRVLLTLTPAGSGALGALEVEDLTRTDQPAGAAAATVTGTVAQLAAGQTAGYAPGDHLDLAVDGGPPVVVQVFSAVYDLETLMGQITTTAGLDGAVGALRTTDDKLELRRLTQGSARTLEIAASSSPGLLAALGLTPGVVAGTDGALADFAQATATQPGGTAWTLTPARNMQRADGSVDVAFTLTPPTAYAAGDGPTAPITVTYAIARPGAALGLGGGDALLGFGARVVRANLLAPYTDATKAVAIGQAAPDPAAQAGF